jgi:hypothetical protein
VSWTTALSLIMVMVIGTICIAFLTLVAAAARDYYRRKSGQR